MDDMRVVRRRTEDYRTMKMSKITHLMSPLVLSLALASGAHAQTVLLKETFQNRPGPTPLILINSYTSTLPSGETVSYSADPYWLTDCNGMIANMRQSPSDSNAVQVCRGQQPWNRVQQMTQALGQLDGMSKSAALDNFAVTAYTSSGLPPSNAIEFESSPINMPRVAGGAGRFISFSVDVSAINCGAAHPYLKFNLIDGATERPVGATIDACSSGSSYPVNGIGTEPARNVSAWRYQATGSHLHMGSTVAVRMRNLQLTGSGNDHAFDNIQILDVSPLLTKSMPSPVKVGEAIRLTFLVSNTPDRYVKQGWSFTDTLDPGLRVASPANEATTCPGATVSAPQGGGTIQVSNGTLSAGSASCTITLDVVASAQGTYRNATANITSSVGLDIETADSVVVVTGNRLTLSKQTLAGMGSFTVTGTNGYGSQVLTTTSVGGTAQGTPRPLGVGSETTTTTVSETMDASWRLHAVKCTGLDGLAAPTFTPAGVVTLPAMPLGSQVGRNVACTLENVRATDLAITKVNETPDGGALMRGQTTRYVIGLTNKGPGVSVGARLKDSPSAGLDCPAANPVSCSGPAGACPTPSLTVAAITSAAGVALGTLQAGATMQLGMECVVR